MNQISTNLINVTTSPRFGSLNTEKKCHAGGLSPTRVPELTFRFANSLHDRRRAWHLAYQVYLAKGYSPSTHDGYWYGRFDARPETQTLLAERKGKIVAALTAVFDSSWQLPADDIHGHTLQKLRAKDRRLCELVSLVSLEQGRQGLEVIKHLFRIAHIYAYHVLGASDLVITVNPRHVRYYKSVLLFEQLGDVTPCPRVKDAPAVLMRLDLLSAASRFRRRYGSKPSPNNLYLFFFEDRHEDLQAWVKRNHDCLSYGELLGAFCRQRQLLSPNQVWDLMRNNGLRTGICEPRKF